MRKPRNIDMDICGRDPSEEELVNDDRRKKLTKILNDLKQSKRVANKILTKMSREKYDSIPLGEIFEVVKNVGLVPLQEDDTEWGGLLCGDNSHAYFTVGWDTSEYEKNGLKFYVPLKNTCLMVCWYKFTSGRYEITTVLT